MEKDDKYLDYAKIHKDEFINKIIRDKEVYTGKNVIFMAGSPGAGKTELAITLSKNYKNMVIIDADYFRTQFPDYNGTNSSLFQKAASWLVEQAFKYLVERGYSFILDATFAVPGIEKKINSVFKKGYEISIYYVYQEPKIAWDFTRAREKVEGRVVPKATFVNAFINAKANVEKIKKRYPEITLNIILKDYQNSVAEVQMDVDNIILSIPDYTKKMLEAELND